MKVPLDFMTMTDIRQNPTAAFIAETRRRFPVEREIDRVLTRKMERRSGPGYVPIGMDELVTGTSSLIRAAIGDDFRISNARWLTGGASKIQMAFDLDWNAAESGARRVTPMVLRMEPPESVVETSRRREFELIQALDGVVPVPPCFWVDAEGEHLPYPALVYGFAQGVTRPTDLPTNQVTGIGLNYGPKFRALLVPQFLDDMGRFHRAGEVLAPRLPSFDSVSVGSNEGIIRQINWWRRVWEEDREQDDPLMEVAYNWLIRNAPPLDHVSIVHGDCRGGNFLFTEDNAKISAWLDWELAVLGDRHQDLAWSMMDPFRHFSEDGRTELISGFLPPDEYLEAYEKASGLAVDPKRLHYYRLFCSYLSVSICEGTGYRVAKGSKTHQDIVVAWLAMISYATMEQLRVALNEVI